MTFQLRTRQGLVAAMMLVPFLAGISRALPQEPERTDPAGSAPFRTRRIEIRYSFRIQDLEPDAREVWVWIPVPPTNDHQRVISVIPPDGSWTALLSEEEFGNRYLLFDLDRDGGPDQRTDRLTTTFRIERSSYRVPAADPPAAAPSEVAAAAGLTTWLKPDTLVPIDGPVAQEAWKIVRDAGSPLDRARRIYEHLISAVTYDKSGTGWGRGDALFACSARRGNCTDFHSLFIGEARAVGLPARFIMGVALPRARWALPTSSGGGVITGYHCWAEFHVDGLGWVPVDASEAHKDPRRRDELFGGLEADRVQFTLGRDIALPRARSGRLNYSIHPHVEVDGALHESRELQLEFRDLD